MLSNLGRQLVSLELAETAAIWPVLFELPALTRLRLTLEGVESAASSAVQLPATRLLANLEILDLQQCSTSPLSLMVGTSMPSLRSLATVVSYRTAAISLTGMESFTALEHLSIVSSWLPEVLPHVHNTLQTLGFGHCFQYATKYTKPCLTESEVQFDMPYSNRCKMSVCVGIILES